MFLQALKAEFKVNNFFYSYRDHSVFYRAQWQWPRPVFLVLRLLLAGYVVYSLSHMVAFHYQVNNSKSLMIFFTVWSYIVLMVHLVLAAVLSVVFYRFEEIDMNKTYPSQSNSTVDAKSDKGSSTNSINESPKTDSTSLQMSYVESVEKNSNTNVAYITDDTENPNQQQQRVSSSLGVNGLPAKTSEFQDTYPFTPWYFKLSWALSDAICIAAPVVTIIFFSALYPNMKKSKDGVGIQDVNIHILNMVFVVVDQLISARPVRLLHIVVPAIYGFLYLLFSVVYWSADHVNNVVYKGVLDYNKPVTATLVCLGLLFVAIPSLQFVFFVLNYFKRVLHKRIYNYYFPAFSF